MEIPSKMVLRIPNDTVYNVAMHLDDAENIYLGPLTVEMIIPHVIMYPGKTAS